MTDFRTEKWTVRMTGPDPKEKDHPLIAAMKNEVNKSNSTDAIVRGHTVNIDAILKRIANLEKRTDPFWNEIQKKKDNEENTARFVIFFYMTLFSAAAFILSVIAIWN